MSILVLPLHDSTILRISVKPIVQERALFGGFGSAKSSLFALGQPEMLGCKQSVRVGSSWLLGVDCGLLWVLAKTPLEDSTRDIKQRRRLVVAACWLVGQQVFSMTGEVKVTVSQGCEVKRLKSSIPLADSSFCGFEAKIDELEKEAQQRKTANVVPATFMQTSKIVSLAIDDLIAMAICQACDDLSGYTTR
ncbi:hypothetical protein DFP72DRAFT_1047961 [Ephemerocybe angulata]|uniref:Uncharacterized protein n=1 Tax=Ephemerocybe angulata TaxID=980116 RepID=A0A8H6HQY9_9AGAR|nr:hypothetical protein DFP72DRAFT_1047961 [Tulosesus angulatus]